eukprot:4887087-Pyramimonas_sp.AAC.1
MGTAPLGPSVELPMGHETCEGRVDKGGGYACGRGHWDPRWSLGAPKRVRGVSTWVAGTHANDATGTF